jgi:glycosyltransferase involved in cell wall biosynthesis
MMNFDERIKARLSKMNPLISAVGVNFKVMVVGGPAEKHIDQCLKSISRQTYTDWTCQVVLDPVGDNTYTNALKYQTDKLKVKLNTVRQYQTANFLDAAKLLDPSDKNIMIMIDADDRLASSTIFSTIASKYVKNSKLLFTYGSVKNCPSAPTRDDSHPYTKEELQVGIRKVHWRPSHLRTFKYDLLKRIKDEDLRDSSGNYFNSASDIAFVLPMIEMAGFDRIEFISEIIYIYNRETGFNVYKSKRQNQIYNEQYIRSKQPYEKLNNFF